MASTTTLARGVKAAPRRRRCAQPCTTRRNVSSNASGESTTNVAVLGASGYTGAEVCRLLATHPSIQVKALTAERSAGRPFSDVFPHLGHGAIGDSSQIMVKADDVDWSDVDVAFCCLPHGTTQEIISKLDRRIRVVDLSADFRLKSLSEYEEWYGAPHAAPDLQKEAVYGLTELKRDAVKAASKAGVALIANPGCYPTSVQLPLCPLLEAKCITADHITIDAKSGVSGAGRGAKEAFLYAEVAEGMHAYGVSRHRHMPEIEQGLSESHGEAVQISFTPHLIPMSRGMLSTMYVTLAPDATVEDARRILSEKYADEKFVHVLPEGVAPHTRHVRGSNLALISVHPDRIKGRMIVMCAIDNLVKGASGQALQNMNLLCGLPEHTGLMQAPMFP
ncbi:hypothetical protein PPROV_000884400 [Pycnococcus provasolii]|uniref:Probable N-acetyl-gamma-glutamyl-phosphate reductase, chloroplastic n=2 Tax=Pycnococcus provasolii TaxID=41880 RepID=A0A830HXE4_9CHLO|nr:hypothetical protein PPROV_000884400 [Pycnococcus provasolii]|mmetsp:Transcript_13764/g.36589  ORF Transcript_13764/g.36589 Transcript_13764/m.36589 type:complete len:392 (+) Transcript_13764:22-1197(+)